jgi:hypothetical protein
VLKKYICFYRIFFIQSKSLSKVNSYGLSSSIAQINRQIEQLKNWSNSGDILLCTYANELFEIRIKELKYIKLNIPSSRYVEFKDGYKALEKYIEYIAR